MFKVKKKIGSLFVFVIIISVLLVAYFYLKDSNSQYAVYPNISINPFISNVNFAQDLASYLLYPSYSTPTGNDQISFLERLLFGGQFYPSIISPFPVSPVGSGPYLPEALFYSPLGDLRFANAGVKLVLANPPKGMYCWDPIGWLAGGFQVSLWSSSLDVKAQSFDKRGLLLDIPPEFIVDPTGETGIMTLLDPAILLFQATFSAAAPNDYYMTVTAGTASTVAVTHRRSATCDVCHLTPPGHIAFPFTWGACHECHKLDSVLHKHALQSALLPIDDCYRCHPAGCLSGVHGQLGIWCTDCHGTLLDAVNDRMLITGQAGLPYCADCHGPLYAENLPRLFKDSRGHGGVWCINCHAPTHIENPLPLGYGDCGLCHAVQATDPSMGPQCVLCHGSSVSPHLVYF